MSISQAEFAVLADVVRRRSGLELPSGKLALAQSKLAPVAARFGFRNVGAMLVELADEPEDMAWAITEAMTVNETAFFRDPACFGYFRDTILPALVCARAAEKRLRIWCAAASTGQEAYSLAMVLEEAGLAARGWKIDLFATDLCSDAIGRAREGLYTQREVDRDLPAAYLRRYFTLEADRWRVSECLRRGLRLRRFNLLDHYGWLGRMDVVFCRNVLIYFDDQTKLETLARMKKCLVPDGWLILGLTESATDFDNVSAPGEAAHGVYAKSGKVIRRQAATVAGLPRLSYAQ